MSLYIQPEAQAQATVGSQEQLTDDTVQPISYFDTSKLKEPSAYFRSSKTSISVAELLPGTLNEHTVHAPLIVLFLNDVNNLHSRFPLPTAAPDTQVADIGFLL